LRAWAVIRLIGNMSDDSLESKGHEGLPPLTDEYLFAWQDGVVEVAKDILRTGKALQPYVFMMTVPDRVQDSIKPYLVTMSDYRAGHMKKMDWSKVPKTGVYYDAILPLIYEGSELYPLCIKYLIPADKQRAVDAQLADMARLFKMTEQKAKEIAVKTLLQTAGIEGKDLMARHIRQTLREAGAMAYIKIDDSWLKLSTTPHDGSSIRDDPEARECLICTMETHRLLRTVMVTYERRGNQRGQGKIRVFHTPQIQLTPREKKEEMGGRFMWMLDPPT
jgi:hypothetical protein